MLAILPLRTSRAQSDSELAATYAPVLHFTSGEKFYPTTVDYIINNSVLMFRNSSDGSATPFGYPTKYNLGNYSGPDWFLNNTLGSFEAISADYNSSRDNAGYGYTAYVHIYNSSTSQVIQYWLFYAYNNGPLNDHQGDIEVIEISLDNAGTPQTALYSQHGAGENAGWGDVEKVDTHPVVYVAQGSHANYFRSWQGKFMVENDVVGSDGLTIQPNSLALEILGERNSHPSNQSWLDFEGRWGFWGNDTDVALGRVGPEGPVFNQNGERWSTPQTYLSDTIGVNNTYFTLAWLIANVFLLFIIYVLAVGAWKVWGIVKLHRKGGLRVGEFLKGPGLIGIILAGVAILITVVALFLPWYSISASSQTGPLSQSGGVELLNIDGVNGMRVNLFMGSTSESTSGYRSLFSFGFPFSLFILVGVILFILDIIGVKSGKKLGLRMILGTIVLFLPFILIIVFMAMLPSFLPWANGLIPGGNIPPQVDTMVHDIAGNPIYGSATQTLPTVGSTTVNWGFGIGAYLFIVAAVLRIAGGVIMRRTPDLEPKAVQAPQASSPPPQSSEQKPSETKT
jgi:hypothetical protein